MTRVTEFRKWVSNDERRLRGRDAHALVDEFSSRLSWLKPDLSIEVFTPTQPRNQMEVIISAAGNRARFADVRELVADAPTLDSFHYEAEGPAPMFIGTAIGVGAGAILNKVAGAIGSKLKFCTPKSRALMTNSDRYPGNRGFLGNSRREYLMPGTAVDRFGKAGGRYVSPKATPLSGRALAPEMAGAPYNAYRVVKPIEVNAGIAAPGFGQPGLGVQYELPLPVNTLLKRGVLEVIP